MDSIGKDKKWGMPGWRIEQAYAPGVLIGNWGEERYNFQRDPHQHTSTHRRDFTKYHGYQPDVTVRRAALLKNTGMNKQHIFTHHGDLYSSNMITWYDEDYNRRPRTGKNQLPSGRGWDGHRLAWLPERSDHPIEGDPTNFGLFQTLRDKDQKRVVQEDRGIYETTYKSSFIWSQPSQESTPVGNAIPRGISSNMHPPNNTNKDMQLRNKPMIKVPEHMPTPPVTVPVV